MNQSPSHYDDHNKKREAILHSPKHKETHQVIQIEPRFHQIREDLASMFLIDVTSEEMLQNPYTKNELYRAVEKDLALTRYFALDYMAKETLHIHGEPLLTKKDFMVRGIRSLRNNGRAILHLYKHKGPLLARIKELFILTGMFTENELEQELIKPSHLH